jgi:1-acyl-sn-glycerol-3-phosphate acyltransferase
MEKALYDPGFRARRIEWLTTTCYHLASNFVRSIYDIEVRNPENLLPLKEKGFVMLPKHQYLLDIILEDIVLHDTIGRLGHFVMKYTLPRCLEWLGGIPIIRTKDLEGLCHKKGISEKEAVQLAKQYRHDVERSLVNLLARDEIVVVHPEGERRPHMAAEPDHSILRNLAYIQTYVGKSLPFVPLDFFYDEQHVIRPRIEITVGSPIEVPANGHKTLTDHWRNSMRLVY